MHSLSQSQMPLRRLTCACASNALFHTLCTLYLQAWCWLAHLQPGSPWRRHHVLGLGLWAGGWLANMYCDGLLRKLRQSACDSGACC
jgi:hypothetical protein